MSSQYARTSSTPLAIRRQASSLEDGPDVQRAAIAPSEFQGRWHNADVNEPSASRPGPDWLGGKGLLSWRWAFERIEAERNYWLVTARRDGFPQARPVWGIWSEAGLLLSVGHGGVQRTALMDGVSIPASAHVDSAHNVVVIEGALDRIAPYNGEQRTLATTLELDPDLLADAARRYGLKYGYPPDNKLLNFIIRPQVIYGWKDEDVKTATRWRFPSI